jgi:glycosyltransferase involved in cell wall biosynthesis
VLLISLDPVDERMAGAAIRSWELAHVLSAHAEVTLATVRLGRISSAEVDLVEFEAHAPEALRPHVMAADVIVAQPQWPVIAGWMHRSGARVIYDLYDPETLETLELFAGTWPARRRLMVAFTLDRLHDALRGGHHFVCASEKQRDLWLGAMYAGRLIDPDAYDRDPSFRSVIDVVPFGLPGTPPRREAVGAIRAAIPEIGGGAEIVLWNGGTWPWLDPVGAVEAFALVAARRPGARLVFMGAGGHPAAQRAAGEARRAAREAGLLDRSVFFNERWVPYAERAGWLLDAACAVATHREHLETRFAFRTRLLDCFWAGLPIVCTAGDELAERVGRDGLGETVAPGDVEGLARALERVLDRGRHSYAAPLAAVAAEFAWPRAAAPLAAFATAVTPPPSPLGKDAPGRTPGHRARSLAYRALRPGLALAQRRAGRR